MNSNNANLISASQRVWVVFSGQTELAYLKWLKPGFRHCYVIMNDGHRWVSVDPLSHVTDVAVHHHLPPDFNLPRWLEDRGMKVVAARRGDIPLRAAPMMVFTCVEAVKRILGVHERRIITPWQLYRHLTQSPSLLRGEGRGEGAFGLFNDPHPTPLPQGRGLYEEKGDYSWAV